MGIKLQTLEDLTSNNSELKKENIIAPSLNDTKESTRVLTSPNLDRNMFWLGALKSIGYPMLWSTSKMHHEIPIDTKVLMKYHKRRKDFYSNWIKKGVSEDKIPGRNIAILYVSSHKSLWETIGVPYATSWHGGYTPHVIIGSNLFKKRHEKLVHTEYITFKNILSGKTLRDLWRGKIVNPKKVLFSELMNKLYNAITGVGGVIVDREKNPIIDSYNFSNNVREILKKGNSLLLFPDGSRSRTGHYKEFKSAGFQGVIDAIGNDVDVYVVPMAIDYTRIVELEKTSHTQSSFLTSKSAYTFEFKDIKNFMITYHDIYLSFGTPIHVNLLNYKEDNFRKTFAKSALNECMNLVKILPVNIVSEAMVRTLSKYENLTYKSDYFSVPMSDLYNNLHSVLSELSIHKDKFRKVDTSDLDKIIIESRLDLDPRNIDSYKLYSNQIAHYLKKDSAI